MGAKEDIETRLAEKTVTKIQGQPTDQSVTLLRKEISKIAASVPSGLGGGKHGHLGLVMSDAEYTAISHDGESFTVPAHSGAYPSTVSNEAAVRAKEEAEHKAKIQEHEVCAGVTSALKEILVEAVDEEWFEEIEDDLVGFANVSIVDMIDHLKSRGGTLDYFEIQAIKSERDTPWDGNENVVTYFARVERCNKQLKRAKITPDETELMNQALYYFKESGELEQGLVNWEAKTEADKTWSNLKKHFTKEFATRHKFSLMEAKKVGYGSSANSIREQIEESQLEVAAMTAEVVQQMKSESNKEMKTLIEQQNKMLQANKDLMTKLMERLMKGDGGRGGGNGGPKRKCPHCGKPEHKDGDGTCWELEANAARRPRNWKSVKAE